jgi:hypothetical protein
MTTIHRIKQLAMLNVVKIILMTLKVIKVETRANITFG